MNLLAELYLTVVSFDSAHTEVQFGGRAFSLYKKQLERSIYRASSLWSQWWESNPRPIHYE